MHIQNKSFVLSIGNCIVYSRCANACSFKQCIVFLVTVWSSSEFFFFHMWEIATGYRQQLLLTTLIKKKIKFSSYYKEIQSGAVAKSYLTNGRHIYRKYLPISSYIRKPFLIDDCATAPLWISLYMRKIWFSFLSVYITNKWRDISLLDISFC